MLLREHPIFTSLPWMVVFLHQILGHVPKQDPSQQPKFADTKSFILPRSHALGHLTKEKADLLVKKAIIAASRGVRNRTSTKEEAEIHNHADRSFGHFGISLLNASLDTSLTVWPKQSSESTSEIAATRTAVSSGMKRQLGSSDSRQTGGREHLANKISSPKVQPSALVRGIIPNKISNTSSSSIEKRYSTFGGAYDDIHIDVPGSRAYSVQLVPGAPIRTGAHGEIFPYNEGGPSGPISGRVHPVVASQFAAEGTASALLANAASFKLKAAELQSKAKELENQAQLLHSYAGGPEVIPQHAPVLDSAVAHDHHHHVDVDPPVPVAITAGQAMHAPAFEPGVPIQRIDTGYPVFHLPPKGPDMAIPDYVKPLPPMYGPNPYEVLTSSSLNGTNYKTYGYLAPLSRDKLFVPTKIEPLPAGYNPAMDIPRLPKSSLAKPKKRRIQNKIGKEKLIKRKRRKSRRRRNAKAKSKNLKLRKRETFIIDFASQS